LTHSTATSTEVSDSLPQLSQQSPSVETLPHTSHQIHPEPADLHRHVAQPPGTPISEQRAASLLAQEHRAAYLMVQSLAQAEETEGLYSSDILMDDDWEQWENVDDEQPAGDFDNTYSLPAPKLGATTDFDMCRQDPNFQNLDASGFVPPQPPSALEVPQSKVNENAPDPFYKSHSDAAPPLPSEVHPQDGVYMLYLLITWLHLQFHLPFRACTAAMNVFLLVLWAFGVVMQAPPVTSLPRIMCKLHIEPTFNVLPCCPKCLEVYPATAHTPSICDQCNTFIFQATLPNTTKRPLTPILRFPYKSIESQLESLLAVPGVEAAMGCVVQNS